MKIYKLDIDASKPIRKVVQMQQNSTGLLSVEVTNDGKYIRNLSCAVYDGTELSATSTNGFKVDMGDTTKVIKVTAKSTPVESPEQYVESFTSGTRNTAVWLTKLVLSAGTYVQDEFMPIADKFGSDTSRVELTLAASDLSSANFTYIYLYPAANRYNYNRIYFIDSAYNIIPQDELITVSSEISVGITRTYRLKSPSSIVYGWRTYPAVGYYTDYSLDTVIKPSTNAACYAEADIQEPTPEPDPEPTPDPEEPVEP